MTQLVASRATIVIAGVGFAISNILNAAVAQGRELPCAYGNTCSAITASRVGHPLGISLSLVAAAVFAGILLLSFLRQEAEFRPRPWQLCAIRIFIVGTAVMAMLLQAYSLIVMHGLCLLCFACALCFCGIAACEGAIGRTPIGLSETQRNRQRRFIGVVAVLATLAIFGFRPYSRPVTVSIDPSKLAKMSAEDLIPSGATYLGSANASETLLMIGDLQCPACKKVYARLMNSVDRKDLRIVYRQDPLPYHKQALNLSILSQIAAEKSLYPAFIDQCEKADIEDDSGCWKIASRTLGISPERSEKLSKLDLAAREKAKADLEFANRLSVKAIPALIRVSGAKAPEAVPLESLDAFLDSLPNGRRT